VFKTATVTIDNFNRVTVVDAMVVPASIIMICQGVPVAGDENEPELDPVAWSVVSVGTGSFVMLGSAKDPIRGSFRVAYAMGL